MRGGGKKAKSTGNNERGDNKKNLEEGEGLKEGGKRRMFMFKLAFTAGL